MIARAGWLAAALSCVAILFAARALEPSPTGLGTHQALGFPPCGFLVYFERPCPGCGLTTAFAHLARFELGSALKANAAGAYLFALNLGLIPLGLFGALRGTRLSSLFEARASRLLLTSASALALLAIFGGWIARLVFWEAA